MTRTRSSASRMTSSRRSRKRSLGAEPDLDRLVRNDPGVRRALLLARDRMAVDAQEIPVDLEPQEALEERGVVGVEDLRDEAVERSVRTVGSRMDEIGDPGCLG